MGSQAWFALKLLHNPNSPNLEGFKRLMHSNHVLVREFRAAFGVSLSCLGNVCARREGVGCVVHYILFVTVNAVSKAGQNQNCFVFFFNII